MGIIRAVTSSFDSVLEEQWLEVVSCGSLGNDTLMARGYKMVGNRSTNTRRDDNVLSNGSIILIADGQCVIVVSQGKVVDVCDEPGEHKFYDESHPGGIKGFFSDVGRRIAYGGGDVQPITHRVYYVNTKECMGNSFATIAPVPFRTVDPNTGMDMDANIMISGTYSYRVQDPVKLYKTLIGNIGGTYTRDKLSHQVTTSLLDALQETFSSLSSMGMRPNQVPQYVPYFREALKTSMAKGWCGEHGLEISSIAISGFQILEAGEIKQAQRTAMLKDPEMAEAAITEAKATAMVTAAENNAAGGVAPMAMVFAAAKPTEEKAWVCRCGTVSKGKYCPECGKPRVFEWTCSCGQKNTGKFCVECGKPKPV